MLYLYAEFLLNPGMPVDSSMPPDYLRAEDSAEGSVPWPYEYMFELTFSDRALTTWAATARLGREGVRDMVINCNNLACLLPALRKLRRGRASAGRAGAKMRYSLVIG